MPDRCGPRGSVPALERRLLALALASVTAVLIGCGSSPGSVAPRFGSAGPTATTPPQGANGSPVTARSSAPGTPGAGAAVRTFPPPQTAIEAGTYGWDGFKRPISFELGAGWALGHNDPSFFDLFRGSDFPSITFARFTDVYVDRSALTSAVDAATVTSTLAGRTDMTITEPILIELGGRTGRQFDLAATQPQTPLFLGPAGDFKLDPEYKTRYRVLDFPGGGVLVIGIHTRDGGFDAGVALGDPVVATLRIAP